jgi:hypothetical protein
MANPFPTKFDSQCQQCESMLDRGDLMYAHDDLFICPDCAEEAGVVCDCGNFKKEDYKKCYDCSQIKAPVQEEKDAWDPWETPLQSKSAKKKDDSLPF